MMSGKSIIRLEGKASQSSDLFIFWYLRVMMNRGKHLRLSEGKAGMPGYFGGYTKYKYTCEMRHAITCMPD